MRLGSKGRGSKGYPSARLIPAGVIAGLGLACLLSGGQGTARAAEEMAEGLSLSAGAVETDSSGGFITVNVKNASQTTYGEIVVTCAFYGNGSALGTSSTVLFATVPGATGSDQVRLMGASAATSAKCRITSAK